jgi:hypothetical protein
MGFELIGELSKVETIAVNLSIRERTDLKARFGGRRWRELKGVGLVRLPNGNRKAEVKNQAILGRMSMTQAVSHRSFVICVSDEGSEDLTAGMVYQALPDQSAGDEGLLRVIDDSGEDYLYPAERFVRVVVSREEETKLLAVAHPGGP